LYPSAHSRLKLTFTSNSPAEQRIIYFNDVRGTGRVVAWQDLDEALSDVGPDILSDEITLALWSEALKTKEQICLNLVDQARVSGIGNYLRADIMYQAGVSPITPGTSLTETQLQKLFEAAKEITNKSFVDGGHSREAYYRLNGAKGVYRPLVYNQRLCPQGHAISFFTDKKRRTCYYCPLCQR